jgi:hypothetical protein
MNPYVFTVSIHPGQLVLASVLALVAGMFYAWLLNREKYRWIAEDATELSVVIGVSMTLGVAGVLFFSLPIFMGHIWLFFLTGASQVIRSAYNRHAAKMSGKNRLKQAAQEANNEPR